MSRKCDIACAADDKISPDEMMALAQAVGFGPGRTLERNAKALANSCFVATARHAGKLVGMIRLIGDGAYILHMADLEVDPAYQRKGVGTRLVELAIQYARRERIGTGCEMGEFTLFAAPGAEKLYRRCGFASLGNGMWLADCEERRKISETR